MSRARILIGGDFVPSGRNLAPLIAGDIFAVLGDTLEVFQQSDLSIVNLECPLVARPRPIQKSGPHLAAPAESLRLLTAITAFSLANNHIMDHGAEGLERTLDACREYGFLTVGAGRDVEAAAQPLIWSNGNLRIGIVAMAEHEFSIATPNDWGANPLDLRRFVRTVAKHRNKWDYLLVLVHGGVENYPYPTPELRDTCRFLVEQGANAVVCQHTHCPGCWEEYLGGYIVYGQGNLLFEKKGTTEGPWTEGFLITLDVPAVGAGSSLSLHPYRQSATEAGIQLLHDGEAGRALELVSMRSARLGDDLFVVEEFRRYVQANVDRYLALLYRRGPWWRRFHHRIRGWRTPRNPKRDLALLNILRAESLREAGATALDFAVKD